MKLPVAIEINEQYLKIVIAKFSVKQRRLSDCICKSTTGLTDKQLAELLMKLFKELNIRPSPLILSIPRNQVTVRNLHLPSQDKKEIEQMLGLHIGRIVLYRKEEIIFNYALLGLDEMYYSKLILAVVHKDVLKRQWNILEAADVLPDKMQLSSYGVWRWILSSQKAEINPTDIYAVLDIDSTFADFIIFNREHILFSRSFTTDIKGRLSDSEITKLIGEVKQSLVIFHNEEMNKNPARLFLSGAMVTGDAEEIIKKEFDIPVKWVQPLYTEELLRTKKREVPSNVSLSSISGFITGEVEKGISFTLPEMQIRKTLQDRTKEVMILGSLMLYLFMVTLAFFWGKVHYRQEYLDRLKEQNKKIEREVGTILDKYQKVKFVEQCLDERKTFLFFISELQKIIPTQIAVTFLSLDVNNKVTLRGQGLQLSDVFRFISTVEGNKYFKDVSTKYTRAKKIKDKEITDFEIVFQFINK